MALTSWIFALYLIGVLIIYWFCGRTYRDIVLILAGLVFYGWEAWRQLPVILALMMIVYLTGFLIRKKRKQTTNGNLQKVTVLGVALLVVALIYYKYWPLLIRTWNGYSSGLGWQTIPIPKITAPLAISFLVFQFIHYIIDQYKGKITKDSWRGFMLYTMFFPTILAGPIKRYEEFSPQIEDVKFKFEDFCMGLARVIIGLSKKIVLADTFALWGDKLLNPEMNSGLMLLVAVYCYSLKIYFDFSGYSDIAIGAAKMFGYEIPENFNWPYLATNISAFWRRWHISLSNWIRDYLFIPLGGSRVPYLRHFINSLVTMGICGLWHGANWTFLVWGVWHGIGLGSYGIYKRSGILSRLKHNRWWKLAGWFATFNFVSFGWIFFAAKTLADAVLIFTRILTIR